MRLMLDRLLRSPEGPDAGTPPAAGADSSPEASIQALLDYDPFQPPTDGGADPGQEGAESTRQPEGSPESQTTAQAGDGAVPPQQPPAPQETQPLAAANPQLAEIAELLRRQQTQQPSAAQPAAPQGPRFNFAVPQEITAALNSEDASERANATSALVNGLANSIYAEIRQEFDAREQALRAAIPQIASQTVATAQTQRQMFDDFWGSYKTLKHTPELGRFVAITAQQMAQEQVAQGRTFAWSPEFRDALAERVHTTLGMPFQKAGAAPPPAAARPPARQPFVAGASGGRSSGPQAPNAVVADIWDTMGF